MKGKRLIAAVAAALCGLLLLLPAQAAEETREKTYALGAAGTSLAFRANEEEAAFWEYPQLAPGQTMTGRLTLVNRSGDTAVMRLDGMILPYDDPEALAYLNAVSIRIAQGDKVLYEGPYVRIADGWKAVEFPALPSGEGIVLDITAWCDYGYDGAVVPGLVTWELGADIADTWEAPAPAEPATWVFWVICGALLVSTACGLLGLLIKRRRRK